MKVASSSYSVKGSGRTFVLPVAANGDRDHHVGGVHALDDGAPFVLWGVGFVLGAGVWWATQSPLLLVILLLGAWQLYRLYKNPRPEYYDIAPARRIVMGGAYFGLLAVMALGMWVTEAPLEALKAEQATLSGPVLVYGVVDLLSRWRERRA